MKFCQHCQNHEKYFELNKRQILKKTMKTMKSMKVYKNNENMKTMRTIQKTKENFRAAW